jgi:hypothetical protein
MTNALMLHETVVILVAAPAGGQRTNEDHVVSHLPDACNGALTSTYVSEKKWLKEAYIKQDLASSWGNVQG